MEPYLDDGDVQLYDADAIREAAEYGYRPTKGGNIYDRVGDAKNGVEKTPGVITHGGDPSTGRNRRSVWVIPTEPFPEAHFATYPQSLVQPCILAGSKPGDLALDPFVGSGTTALVARKHGRRCIGIDLSTEYLDIAAKRTRQLSLLA